MSLWLATCSEEASSCNNFRVSTTAFVRSCGIVIIGSVKQVCGNVGVRLDVIHRAPSFTKRFLMRNMTKVSTNAIVGTYSMQSFEVRGPGFLHGFINAWVGHCFNDSCVAYRFAKSSAAFKTCSMDSAIRSWRGVEPPCDSIGVVKKSHLLQAGKPSSR